MDLDAAKQIFDSINDYDKDVITMNAMMDAYCISDYNQECIELFENIQGINKLIIPDMVSYKIGYCMYICGENGCCC